MLDNFDFKCAFGVAIMSVLIYCLITTYLVTDGGQKFAGCIINGGEIMKCPAWYKSLEFLMAISIMNELKNYEKT